MMMKYIKEMSVLVTSQFISYDSALVHSVDISAPRISLGTIRLFVF